VSINWGGLSKFKRGATEFEGIFKKQGSFPPAAPLFPTFLTVKQGNGSLSCQNNIMIR